MDEELIASISRCLNAVALPPTRAAAHLPNIAAVNATIADAAAARLRVDRAPVTFDTLRSLHAWRDRS